MCTALPKEEQYRGVGQCCISKQMRFSLLGSFADMGRTNAPQVRFATAK